MDRLIGHTFTALWSAGFAIMGRLRRRPVPHLVALGGQVVWVVSPHPDDEVIGSAFAMLRHANAGDRVLTIFVTDGRASRAHGLGPDEMARERKKEAAKSQLLLGLPEHRWLGLKEGEWQRADLVARLRMLATSIPPDVVYAPSLVDFHPEHQNVARALAEFLAKSGLAPAVRIVQIHVPITSILVNLVASGEGLSERARQARAAYRTQALSIDRTYRMRRYAGGFHREGREVEEYWQMPAAAYARLHSSGSETSHSKFQGLRYRPLSDPLRYLAGRAERKRLLAVAAIDAS
jgi:LmbE family N-acetylglucosaminyl deacetylase